MKKNLLIACLCSIATVSLALLAGCHRQSSESGTTPVSAEKNSFREVTSKLDPGGDLYLYLSTEQILTGASEKISNWKHFFESLPRTGDGNIDEMEKAFDLVTAMVKDSGLEDVSGFGMSAIAIETNFYRSKALLHHYNGRGSGFLWKMMGATPHELDGLDLAPSNTALAVFSDLDANIVWTEIKKLVDSSDFPEAQDALAQLPAKFEQATGLNWGKTLDSLGGEFGVVLTLDDANQTTLPFGGKAQVQIPEPGLMIVAKVKNDLLFDRIDERLKNMGQQLISVDKGGLRMRTFPVPLPLPIQLRPSVATSDGYLIIATTDYMIQDALAVKSGKAQGLRSTAEFKRLSAGIPSQGNHFTYVSQLLGQTIFQLQKQAMESLPKTSAAQVQQLESMLQPNAGRFAYCVGANTDEGWYVVGNGNQAPAATFLAAAVVFPAGILAGVAVPNFVKARTTAQSNACINNLRQIDAAKQQWALEKNMPATAMPSKEDLKPYLARSRFPQCPQGGQYTIGAVNEHPTCSIPGHRLP